MLKTVPSRQRWYIIVENATFVSELIVMISASFYNLTALRKTDCTSVGLSIVKPNSEIISKLLFLLSVTKSFIDGVLKIPT